MKRISEWSNKRKKGRTRKGRRRIGTLKRESKNERKETVLQEIAEQSGVTSFITIQ